MELAILGAVVYLKFFRKWNYTCLNGVNALDPGQTQTLSICLHWLSSSNNFFLLFSANRFCKYKNGRKDSVLKWTWRGDSVHVKVIWFWTCQWTKPTETPWTNLLRFAQFYQTVIASDALQDEFFGLALAATDPRVDSLKGLERRVLKPEFKCISLRFKYEENGWKLLKHAMFLMSNHCIVQNHCQK